MAGPKGERCIDCIKYDPSKRVCRAKSPMPMIGLEGKNYTLVLPAVMTEDYCVDDFSSADIQEIGEA